jgi:DNA-nicking Smr family endonuclease
VNSTYEPGNKRRHRALSREEIELWREVTRSIARLRVTAKRAIDPPEPPGSSREPARPPPALPGYTPPPQRPTNGAPALRPLDRRMRKKLARGHMAVDAMLDLHGMRQDEAHSALRSFLLGAQSRDARMVLVITGKGLRGGASRPERGVLYRSVPHWLASADLRRIVIGFEEADAAHGGAGALYVRLRRPAKATSPEH